MSLCTASLGIADLIFEVHRIREHRVRQSAEAEPQPAWESIVTG